LRLFEIRLDFGGAIGVFLGDYGAGGMLRVLGGGKCEQREYKRWGGKTSGFHGLLSGSSAVRCQEAETICLSRRLQPRRFSAALVGF
jgi:hypothetical protein